MGFKTELGCRTKEGLTAGLVAGATLLTRVQQVKGGWRMWFKLLQEQRRRHKEKQKKKLSGTTV